MRKENPERLPEIGGYTFERLIDTGGFSRVYRAIQHGLDRPVAIKVLNSTFEDERQQQVFDRECKVMGQLSSHPNIVTVFASALTKATRPSIVMELYDGTYRNEGTLDVREVIHVGAQVADALQTIHERGIVHRDIKPHNIFISSNGVPAIGDFGISSIENERTVTGAAGFSINYAPPEVFEDGGAGAPGDIYSLGATLYQLATGNVPFPHHGEQTDRVRATVHKIITAPPPSLNVAGAPPALDRLIRLCMAKGVADRPATPRDVASELRKIQREVGFPEQRQRTPTPERPPEDSDNQTISRSETATRNRTVLRDVRSRPAEIPEVELERPSGSGPRDGNSTIRRNVLIGAGALIAIVVASVLITGRGGSSITEPSVTNPPPSVASEIRDVEILSPPDDVTVSDNADGTFTVDWTRFSGDVKYQLTVVGTSDTRLVDSPPYVWTPDDDTGSNCFAIRTVNAAETKMSQSASAPACPS